MANAASKPTAEIMAEARKEMLQAQGQKAELRKTYMAEEQVPMYLSPMYRPYFGNVMPVKINGVAIYMPVDGSTKLVPESYADEITRRRMAIDASLTKQGVMSDISKNAETAPGELKLF